MADGKDAAWWRSRRWLMTFGVAATVLALVAVTVMFARPGGAPDLSIEGVAAPTDAPQDEPSAMPPSAADSPSHEPSIGTPSEPEASSANPTATATTTAAPSPPPPSPTPTATTSARHNPAGFTLVGSLDADRRHLYEGESTTIEVSVCNTNQEAPVVYATSYAEDFALFVMGPHGSVGGASRFTDTPHRYEQVPAGDCLAQALTWNGTDKHDGTPVDAGIYEVSGEFRGRDPDAGPDEMAHVPIDSVFVEVHDGPRPGGEEPPPPDGYPGPEWSLHVTTDADSHVVGDPVSITVQWCNETDVEQEYTDSSLTEYEFDLGIFLEHDDGSIEEQAWLQGDDHNGTGTGEYQYLGPGECMGDTITWRGTTGNFSGDGSSDGGAAPPGRYLIKAWKGSGPSGAYTRSQQAETTTHLTAA
jgi:hypothetical protein